MSSLSRFKYTVLTLSLLANAATDPAGYVGSKVCFGCHQGIYRSFVQTDMGRSMRLATDMGISSLPPESTVPVGSSARVARVSHDANGWSQSESEPNVFIEEHKLEYAVGSGENGVSFLIRRGGYLFQAPLSFYSKIGKWDLSPGYENVDIGFTRPVPEACITCHSGRARAVPSRSGEYLDPPFRELAIGCENCHGPGQAHVHSSRPAASSIINPAKLPVRRAEDICMNCHQRGDTRVLQQGKRFSDFRPGQSLLHTLAIFKVPQNSNQPSSDLLEHDEAMKASRCFRASAGRLSCFTCHDPHTQPRGVDAVAYFRQKCLTCHTDASCGMTLAERMNQHPADNCIACHMPKRDVAVISHSALTNHMIPATNTTAPPQQSADPQTGMILVDKPAGEEVPVSDITLLRAYAELAPRFPAYQDRYLATLARLSATDSQDLFVQAALGHKALSEGKNEEALAHLSAAMSLEEATIYRDMAQALTNLGRGDEAADYLKRASEAYPFDPVLSKTLILNYINSKRYPEARQAMEQYVKLFPADAFMRDLLGRVSH